MKLPILSDPAGRYALDYKLHHDLYEVPWVVTYSWAGEVVATGLLVILTRLARCGGTRTHGDP